jgi:hypothetical protein
MKNQETRQGGRRVGAGRKPLDCADRLRPCSIYLTDEEWESCQVRLGSGISGSEHVRRLIQKDIKQRRLREQEHEQGQIPEGENLKKTPTNQLGTPSSAHVSA